MKINAEKPKLNDEFLEHRLSTAFLFPAEKISYKTTASAFFAKSIQQDTEDHLERVSITELQC